MPSQMTTALPAIPVRLNRTLVLRQRSRAKRGDSNQTFNPVNSDVSGYVQGQNKAVKQGFKKQIHTFFREQTFMLEKLNRYQTQAFENLERLELEKRQLVSYADVIGETPENDVTEEKPPSPPKTESPAPAQKAVGLAPAQKAVGFNETAEVTDGTVVRQVTLPPLSSIPEGNNEPNSDVKRRLVSAVSLPELDHKNPSARTITSDKTLKKGDISTTSVENLAEFVAKEPPPPNPADGLFHLTESPLPGARRADVPVPGSAGSSIDPRALYQKLRARPSSDTPKPSLALMKIRHSKTTLDEKRSKRLDRSPWTLYNRNDVSGEITPSPYPYKRREFVKPKEKDWGMYRALIRAEDKHRRKARQRFERLSADLDTLEKWNPLDDIRDRYHLKPLTPPGEMPGAKLQRMQGSLGAMIAAFGGQEEWILSQLDPDSPEALKLCRYLRLKQDQVEDDLGGDIDNTSDRLARRQSWTVSGRVEDKAGLGAGLEGEPGG